MDKKEISLTRNKVAVVDTSDYDFLMQWKWKCSDHGYAVRNHHVGIVSGKRIQKRIYMHRLIMDAPIGQYVDHINGNSLDNCRSNLRICTNQQNSANSRKYLIPTSSEYKGVSWDEKNNKWRASIHVLKAIYLGRFSSEIEAAKAYNYAAKDAWGEFARLNIV